MKILLIYPYFLEQRIHQEEIAAVPMGLYYVGAMLKAHGHKVDILNWHNAGLCPGSIKETLISGKPDLIGFSILHANRWGGIDIARIAKAIRPDMPIVFGGVGASFLWKHLLTHFTEIDYVIVGEGEHAFLDLARAIEAGISTDALAAIDGLVWRADRRIINNGAAAPIEHLDDLPAPAQYFDFQHLSLTRGCPGRCTFCGSPQFWGRRVRSHSADYFVDQLARLVERGITFFYVSDDTFTLNPELVIEVCQKILQRGLTIVWQAIAKVNAINEKMLYWMRKAGCVQISYGVESGSTQIRKRLCKDISEAQIHRAFALTTAHGILARAYFIYGVPGETNETIEQTLALMVAIRPLSAIFYILTLFPGTTLYDEFVARKVAGDDIWLQRIEDIFSFEDDPNLDEDEVMRYGRLLRQTFHGSLPEFARQIELKDDPSLKAEQADFLSRLGMTFSHGDYAQLEMWPTPDEVAKGLFERALALHSDHRAFWGLALIYQRRGDLDQTMTVIEKGLACFPNSEALNICRGVGFMNQGVFDKALECLLPFASSQEARPFIKNCQKALGIQSVL